MSLPVPGIAVSAGAEDEMILTESEGIDGAEGIESAGTESADEGDDGVIGAASADEELILMEAADGEDVVAGGADEASGGADEAAGVADGIVAAATAEGYSGADGIVAAGAGEVVGGAGEVLSALSDGAPVYRDGIDEFIGENVAERSFSSSRNTIIGLGGNRTTGVLAVAVDFKAVGPFTNGQTEPGLDFAGRGVWNEQIRVGQTAPHPLFRGGTTPNAGNTLWDDTTDYVRLTYVVDFGPFDRNDHVIRWMATANSR